MVGNIEHIAGTIQPTVFSSIGARTKGNKFYMCLAYNKCSINANFNYTQVTHKINYLIGQLFHSYELAFIDLFTLILCYLTLKEQLNK